MLMTDQAVKFSSDVAHMLMHAYDLALELNRLSPGSRDTLLARIQLVMSEYGLYVFIQKDKRFWVTYGWERMDGNHAYCTASWLHR